MMFGFGCCGLSPKNLPDAESYGDQGPSWQPLKVSQIEGTAVVARLYCRTKGLVTRSVSRKTRSPTIRRTAYQPTARNKCQPTLSIICSIRISLIPAALPVAELPHDGFPGFHLTETDTQTIPCASRRLKWNLSAARLLSLLAQI